MLQNPSKYHANPLSHFLALHNSQVVHNGINSQSLPSGAAVTQSQYYHQQQLRHNINPLTNQNSIYQQQQQQQQQQHQQASNNQNLPLQLNQNHQDTWQAQQLQLQLQQQQQRQLNLEDSHSNHRTHTPMSDDGNTSLDAGKSFTIAAILGLQKNAIEANQKEYNSVINLSLSTNNSSRNLLNNKSTNKDTNSSLYANTPSNFSSQNEKIVAKKGLPLNMINSISSESNGNLICRFLPAANVSLTTTSTTTSSEITNCENYGATMIAHQQSTFRANSFAVAVAAAAANATTGNVDAPSALQSLQKLHQHHAQQASLSFQREKLKTENKKSSIKNKRVRTIFTPEQLERLEAEFERQQYMVGPERLYLAHTLQLTEAQVKVWFQNRRIKWRKHHLEITQQRLAILRQTQMPHSNATDDDNKLRLTGTSSMSYEDISEVKQCEHGPMEDSPIDSDSDLSICNDSIDGDSVIDGGDDT